jgi:acid phosphatase type 7
MKAKLSRLCVAFLQILTASFVLIPSACSSGSSGQPFLVSPYVQLGYGFNGKNLTVAWLSENQDGRDLKFEFKAGRSPEWKSAPLVKQTINGQPKLSLYSAEMTDLPLNSPVSYRISKDGQELFQACAQGLPSAGKTSSFSVFGDVGKGTQAQAQVAAQMQKKQPGMILIVGDIVYPNGSLKNYLRNFFPYMNSQGGEPGGSALMQSTLTVAVVGNHDLTSVSASDLDANPDGMAYFTLWKEPLNGPATRADRNIPQPQGSKERIDDFLKAAGSAYPRMANFSYDWGDCHFLCLDGDKYMDWTDPALRQWVESDLKQAKARWKIVAFHQPGFNSDWAHREEQRMRHLSDIFERCGVDICFAGHAHSYQRSYPLRFHEIAPPADDREARAGYVYGSFKIDKKFDGEKNCKPDGVVYVVTGAGGADLSGGNLEAEPGQWLPFTRAFSSKRHSFTFCRVEPGRLSVEQIGDDGQPVDRFLIVK